MRDLDPAILPVLSRLKPHRNWSMKLLNQSNFSENFRIEGRRERNLEDGLPGSRRRSSSDPLGVCEFFVKIGDRSDGRAFEGEFESLKAITHAMGEDRFCNEPVAHGPTEKAGYFLITSFLNLTYEGGGPGKDFAKMLARMHKAPVPVPDGCQRPMFGFWLPTCCGTTEQNNEWMKSWAGFYGEKRLRRIGQQIISKSGYADENEELEALLNTVIRVVVPRMLRDGHLKTAAGAEGAGGPVRPSLIHGDLWAGNAGKVKDADGMVRDVVFDPSACYAHNEFELGGMKVFGGFGGVYETYFEEVGGMDEPVEEFEDRMDLYMLYHQLNHVFIFEGIKGTYRSNAMRLIKSLLDKYGPKDGEEENIKVNESG